MDADLKETLVMVADYTNEEKKKLMSDCWIIPGTEDLNDTWHNVHVKQWKMLQLIPFSIPVSAIIGGLYWGIKVLIIHG